MLQIRFIQEIYSREINMILSLRPLTILTLPNEFPLVFAFRVTISVAAIILLILLSRYLYNAKKIDKLQRNSMIVLSVYVVLMLYYTVIGRYFQSYYRYDGQVFSSFYSLVENFNMSSFSLIIINLLMMVPVSFLLMLIFRSKFRVLWAFDLTIILIFTIEISQFFTRAGTFQLEDILNNTIGAVVGIILFYILNAIYKKRNERL